MAEQKNKYTPTPALREWLLAVDPPVKKLLGRLAGTSEAMYRQWISGRRNLSADKAGALESAMTEIFEGIEGAPKPLTRGDLCDACRKCPYFLTYKAGVLWDGLQFRNEQDEDGDDLLG